VLNAEVATARHLVWERIDRATSRNDYECQIPIYVYSGMSDGIVKRTSAQSFFLNAGSLPGNHSSILDPDEKFNLTFPILKHHLLNNLYQAAGQAENAKTSPGESPATPSPQTQLPEDATSLEEDVTGLERATSLFTGRARQIAEIERAVSAAPRPQDVRAVFAIHGMAGIGKTALAVHVAHRLVDSLSQRVGEAGLQLFATHENMHGLAGLAQRDPANILRYYLKDADTDKKKDADIDSRKELDDLGELAKRWRRHLIGKFLVLVLDNVSDTAQVLPFLPSRSGHIVLVASRHPLQRLDHHQGIVRINLPVLSKKEAVRLIEARSRRAARKADLEAVEG
jgi:AAA ATPase domain